ncbi:MAG: hypothetical protein JXR76_21625 [Deltaproteobacteria bacterium]|nr:hypothetical protein [Deltaproteobacteria bacterium]
MSVNHSAISMPGSYAFKMGNHRFGAHFGDGYAHGIAVVPEDAYGACEVRDLCEGAYLYQGLYRNGQLIDINDPAQMGRHLPFIRKARGEVLVTNAGLGGFLYRLLRKPEVWHITVAEPDFDIIELVEPTFSKYADKVTFVHGDWDEIARYNIFDEIYLG